MIEHRDKEQRSTWHAQPIEKILSRLETSINGLTQEESLKRQAKWGLNRIPAKAKESIILRFLKHFNNILIYVLLFAAIVTGVETSEQLLLLNSLSVQSNTRLSI